MGVVAPEEKKIVVKGVSLQAWTGPDGSRRLRLPEFLGKLLGNNHL